jgi:hypothetical protein
MHYRLRTLLILMAIGPPIVAVFWTNRSEIPANRLIWMGPVALVGAAVALLLGVIASFAVEAMASASRWLSRGKR